MKKILRLKIVALLAMFMFIVFTTTSCVAVLKSGNPGNGNNGKHKGWHKGKGNPHKQSSATPWESIENSESIILKINGCSQIVKKEIS
ncbi:MAG: hypothetical protein JEZ09_16515 [Salinivirgaceae bacterium]|nr:hypothetical protein [Salinivirgaceae bacterium]